MDVVANKKSIDDIAKGGVWLMAGTAISRALAYLYKIVVARIGTVEFGIFSAATAVIETVATLAAVGLPTGIFYFIPHYKARGEKDKINSVIASSFKLTVGISIVFSVILFFFADVIAAKFFHNSGIAYILKTLALIIPVRNVRNLLVKVLIGFQMIKFRVYARNIAEDAVRLIVTAGLLIGGFGLMAAIYGYMAGMTASLVLAVYLLEKKTFSFVRDIGKGEARYSDILGYSLPLFLSGFVGYFLRWTDTFVLSYFRTMEDVGIYNVAMIVASFITILPEMFMPSAYPVIVNNHSLGMVDESYRLARIVNKWIFLCAIPSVGMVAFFSREITAVLFGSKYLPAVVSVMIFLFGKFLWTVGNIGSRMLTMIRKNTLMLYINIGLVLFNLIFNIALVPRYGMVGAAASTASALCIEFVIYLYLARRYFGISLIPDRILSILGAGIVPIFPIALLRHIYPHQSIFSAVAQGCSYMAIYAALLWGLRILTGDDMAFVRVITKKIKDMKR